MTVHCTPQLPLYAAAALLAASLCGCSSKSPCQNPTGEGCGRTGAYTDDDPHSICHVCCESAGSSDAWTEVSQTDVASGQFSAFVSQNHPAPGTASFSMIGATWNGAYFSFDGQTLDGTLNYHLLTRGRNDEGNLQLFVFAPGDCCVSAAPLNCTIARN